MALHFVHVTNKARIAKTKMSTFTLEQTQTVYEKRFNCIVCLSPRFNMVYGLCQHRVCDDCLYTESGDRRHSFDKCPVCLQDDMFPLHRPDIPEDNIEHQRCLGVRSCPHEGCRVEMWEWEVEEHLLVCPSRAGGKSNKRRHTLPAEGNVHKISKSKSKKLTRRSKSVVLPQSRLSGPRLRPRP